MGDVQRRYTDKELITLLQILASDYNRKPTQRDVLDDDRLPTHHTMIKRFGSMNDAVKKAGLGNLEDSNLHEVLKSIFDYYDIEVVGEWVAVGPLVVDFHIKNHEYEYHVDVVEMGGTVIQEEIASMRMMLATPYSDCYRQIASIGDVMDLAVILSGVPVAPDTVGE